MTSSVQPRKQRKSVYTAPLHARRKQLRAHLSKDLRKQLKKRSALVRKGDKVRVLSGDFKGAGGSVTSVDYSRTRVFVEGIIARKQGGREKQVPIQASVLLITEQAPKQKA